MLKYLTTATLALLSAISTAQAETAMTVEEFEAFVTDRNFTFGHPDQTPYTVDSYAPGRRFVWVNYNGACGAGTYRAGPDSDICFDFYNDGGTTCRVYVPDGEGGLLASIETPYQYAVRPTPDGLHCDIQPPGA